MESAHSALEKVEAIWLSMAWQTIRWLSSAPILPPLLLMTTSGVPHGLCLPSSSCLPVPPNSTALPPPSTLH